MRRDRFFGQRLDLGIVVVSRLRKDACLFDLPPEGSHGNRIYGKHKISLAKRAGHRQGWQTITYVCRGVEVTRQYKTFQATTHLISGMIRVVLVRFEDGGWALYFCTDASASVRDILETAAARWAIEEHFHDVKEVWGAGQQRPQCLVEYWLLALEPVDVHVGGVGLLGRAPVGVE